MNLIRTKSVELTTIPAIAYKQKLSAGGAGIKIIRLDMEAHGVATLDKRTGEAKPYGKVDEQLFPIAAFDEAMGLTKGMPYAARKTIKSNVVEQSERIEEVEEVENEVQSSLTMVDSDEYRSIVEQYRDEKGNINYILMNKDFIQFASKSKTVSELITSKALVEDILLFIVKNRAAYIANKKETLDDQSTNALIDTLDEINPRSAFKELKKHIKTLLSKKG